MLDHLVINSRFVKGIIEKVVIKAIKSKTGCNATIKLNQLELTNAEDDVVNVKLSIEGSMKKEDIMKLLKDL